MITEVDTEARTEDMPTLERSTPLMSKRLSHARDLDLDTLAPKRWNLI